MRSVEDSDTVADIQSARAKRAFDNWINSHRDDVLSMYSVMQEQGATPLSVRYVLQFAYQHGFKEGTGITKGGEDHHGDVFLETEL